MTTLDDLRSSAEPAQLFLIAWSVAIRLSGNALSMAKACPDDVKFAVADALTQHNGADAVIKCCAALRKIWPEGAAVGIRQRQAGLLLQLMREIDIAMAHVHPRSRLLPPYFTRPAAPAWVREAGERRTAYGVYAQTDTHFLVPRGPFARNARGRFHEGGFSLPDQFGYLGCGVRRLDHDSGTATVHIHVIDQGIARGVPPRKRSEGAERVTFVPLAEASTDLVPRLRELDGTAVIDITQGGSFHPLASFTRAVRDAADSDMLLAPELTIVASDLDGFAHALASGPSPRLVVAGSGLMPARDHEPPVNEAVMLNALGATLWRHRKVWAYGMNKPTFERLDLGDLPDTQQLMENITCGDTFTIADVDGLGRCLVLICQDLMIASLPALLHSWQPDWVFVPILDTGTGIDRWSTHRAITLSFESQGHFLVCSSLTMVHWLKDKSAAPGKEIMAVAIGPGRTAAADKGSHAPLARAEVACESSVMRHGTVEWHGLRGWLVRPAK
ncbi:hypothetical protein EDC65_1722 [Stella humosa]|uniref:Uncharacterized protein n=1 Tax=Stella humosa TaxID=94 RepID=A0A3N1M8A2_9PROT|nr:hypothetical protein [Stella humosa]ROP99927.1 hypothetical protein EDC65_1722 [Stella humosa]BBK30843.1 hypothetical protein STHU_14770 [Stella humosa]